MYLIGLKALNAEHTFLGTAAYQAKILPTQIKGAVVDCLLLKCESLEDEDIVRKTLQNVLLGEW